MRWCSIASKNLVIIVLLLLCVVSDILVYSEVWMNWYTSYIFFGLSTVLAFVFGIFPFSVGDLIYTFILCFLVFMILRCLVYIFKKRWQKLWRHLYKLFCVGALFYLGLNVLWNYNYYRTSVATQMNFKLDRYNTKELILLGEYLIKHINLYRSKINQDEQRIAHSGLEIQEIINMAYVQIKKFSEKYGITQLSNSVNVKATLYPIFFNYLQISGYYIPFTSEANINTQIPQTSIPFTVLHELAHRCGVASEGEANFIAFLCGSSHNHSFIRYSAYFNAARYVLSQLRKVVPDEYKQLYMSLNEGVKRDLRYLQAYYQKYANPLDKIFDNIYDTYLKSQNQVKGIRSYNAMVALMIAARVYENPVEL